MDINSAIKKMKPGKAPGSDEFPIECFKTFGPKLILLLSKVFKEVLVKKNSSPNYDPSFYKIMPKLIHPDQTGFIAGRQLSSNLRRVFNIIYQPNNVEPELILSLDVQKAFDRIEYDLFTALNRFGFGPTFCSLYGNSCLRENE